MHGWPVQRLPNLPCDGAFRVVAVATQVADVDAPTPHKHRDEPRGQDLPRWETEPRPLLQEIVAHGHRA
jgi:hypothetical protein